jgi:acyl dehydratase
MKKYFVPLGLESVVDYEFYQYLAPMGQIYVHIFCVISSLAKIFPSQFGEEFLFVSVFSKLGFDSVFFLSPCLVNI